MNQVEQQAISYLASLDIPSLDTDFPCETKASKA